MGNWSKKILGLGAIGAAAGAAAYYVKKKKDEDPKLQEDFADFQDNIKETASSAMNVASRLKEKVEKTVEDTVQKVKEHQYVLSDVINSRDYEMFTVGIEQIAEELKENFDTVN